MTALRSFSSAFHTGLLALAIVLFVYSGVSQALAQQNTPGPDTSASSDAVSAPAADSPASASDSASSPPSSGTAPTGSESSSQAKKKDPVSHEQEAKDRLFIDATSIAAAIFLCVIAVFLFMSLPKQSKKAAGSDN